MNIGHHMVIGNAIINSYIYMYVSQFMAFPHNMRIPSDCIWTFMYISGIKNAEIYDLMIIQTFQCHNSTFNFLLVVLPRVPGNKKE